MPSSELQSRITSLPTSWDPWIWQWGAEGGTIIGRISNKYAITTSQTMTEVRYNIQYTRTSLLLGHIPGDYLSEACDSHVLFTGLGHRCLQLQLAGNKYVKGATLSGHIFKVSYGLAFTLLPKKNSWDPLFNILPL